MFHTSGDVLLQSFNLSASLDVASTLTFLAADGHSRSLAISFQFQSAISLIQFPHALCSCLSVTSALLGVYYAQSPGNFSAYRPEVPSGMRGRRTFCHNMTDAVIFLYI